MQQNPCKLLEEKELKNIKEIIFIRKKMLPSDNQLYTLKLRTSFEQYLQPTKENKSMSHIHAVELFSLPLIKKRASKLNQLLNSLKLYNYAGYVILAFPRKSLRNQVLCRCLSILYLFDRVHRFLIRHNLFNT